MKICELLDDNHIVFDLKPGDKIQLLTAFVRTLKSRKLIRKDKPILDALLEREKLGSTGLEKGVAVPHALSPEVKKSFLALGLVKQGTDYESADQKPTFVFFLLLGNPSKPGMHLKILAHICRLVKETHFVEEVRNIEHSQDVCKALERNEEKIG